MNPLLLANLLLLILLLFIFVNLIVLKFPHVFSLPKDFIQQIEVCSAGILNTIKNVRIGRVSTVQEIHEVLLSRGYGETILVCVHRTRY